MAKTDFYTIKSDPKDDKHFIVQAVDIDFNPTKTYHINGSVCDCWAGHRWCRHKQVLLKFKTEGRVDSNKYWNYDKEAWLPQAEA